MQTERPTLRCVVIGSGGHACVVLDCLEATGDVVVAGILVPDRELWGSAVRGIPILGDDGLLPSLLGQGITHFVVAVGGTGDNGPRSVLYELAEAAGLLAHPVRHPSSMVSSSASIGAGSQLLPGSIVNARARLGRNVIVNTGAIVEHDCEVADHAHIATGATLAGGVLVGRGAHIGAGATVIQGMKVGERAIVGAGAVVVKDVPLESVVAGVPARPLAPRQRR